MPARLSLVSQQLPYVLVNYEHALPLKSEEVCQFVHLEKEFMLHN